MTTGCHQLTFPVQPMSVEDGGQREGHGGHSGQDPEETKRTPQLGLPQVIFLPELAHVGTVLSGLELEEILHLP